MNEQQLTNALDALEEMIRIAYDRPVNREGFQRAKEKFHLAKLKLSTTANEHDSEKITGELP